MTFREAIEIVQCEMATPRCNNPTHNEACEVIFQFMERWSGAIEDMERFGEEDK
tara:strand:- start:34 stop:195 length:162 start_codon:yes stop_codon:yes gene_type:complete